MHAVRCLLLSLALATGCSTAQLTDSAPAPPDPGKSPAANPDGGVEGPASTSAVTIVVEPSDKGAALRDAIANAKKSVHMTMYLLTSSTIITALIAQHNAGHDVKVVLNQNFPQGVTNENQSSFNQLKSAGVGVVWAADTFTFTHSKCVIVDGTDAWIMTMNATFTSPTDNREFLAIDTDPQDVAQAEEIFKADFDHQPSAASGKLLVSPVNAQSGLVALIRSAQTSIDVEAEVLSDTTITDELVLASDGGKTVRVVLDGGQTPTANQQAAIDKLKQHHVKLVKVTVPDIHAKAMVVDGARAYVGSINFTMTSLTANRELGVIFDKASEVSKVEATIAADFATGTPL